MEQARAHSGSGSRKRGQRTRTKAEVQPVTVRVNDFMRPSIPWADVAPIARQRAMLITRDMSRIRPLSRTEVLIVN